MQVSMVLNGAQGKMWSLDMEYVNLPVPMAMEISSACRAMLNYVKNMPGGAASSDPAYHVSFTYDAAQATPEALPPSVLELFHGQADAQNLLYSQAVDIQNAGMKMLEKLLGSAAMEIASGQRK